MFKVTSEKLKNKDNRPTNSNLFLKKLNISEVLYIVIFSNPLKVQKIR